MSKTAKQFAALFLVALVICLLAWRFWPDGRQALQQQRNSELLQAVAQSRLADAARLLDEGADPNTQTQPLSLSQKAQIYYHYLSHGTKVPTWSDPDKMDVRWSVLQVAIVQGNADMVNVLLTKGADVGHRDRMGETALKLAKMELGSSLTTDRQAQSFRRIIVQLRAAEARRKAP